MRQMRKMIGLALLAMLAGALFLPGRPAAAAPAISIMVNGRVVKSDVSPFLDANNRTMVPLRLVAEELHYQVDWSAGTRQVMVTNGATQVVLKVGSREASVDGRQVRLDTAAILRDGRTFVPLRFIGESMGAQVLWEASAHRVVVTTSTGAVAVVKTDVLNVRQGPGTSYPLVGQARREERLPILAVGQGWLRVELGNGKSGWVSSSLVELAAALPPAPAPPAEVPAPPTEAPVPPPGQRVLLVTAEEANVRQGPGTSFPVVASVYRGDHLAVTGQEGDWFAVELPGGQRGWVAASLAAVRLPPVASREDGDGTRPLPPLAWGSGAAPAGNRAGERLLTGAEVRQAEDRLLVTLAGSGALEARTMRLSAPARLVLDLPDTRLAGDEPGWTLEVGHPLLARVRGSLFTPDTVRVVLDLAEGATASLAEGATPGTLQVLVERPGLVGRTIVLDPGHGSVQPGNWSDPGATGVGGLLEREVNMDIASRLAALLTARGAEVVLTRTADTTLSLEGRAGLANQLQADIFVSIHANASPNPALNGTATYFHAPWGSDLEGQRGERLRLARLVQNAMVQAVGRRDLGVLEANFAVLRYTLMPSILVETAFVTNAEEARLLSDPSVRQSFAQAIARGIEQYFTGQE